MVADPTSGAVLYDIARQSRGFFQAGNDTLGCPEEDVYGRSYICEWWAPVSGPGRGQQGCASQHGRGSLPACLPVAEPPPAHHNQEASSSRCQSVVNAAASSACAGLLSQPPTHALSSPTLLSCPLTPSPFCCRTVSCVRHITPPRRWLSPAMASPCPCPPPRDGGSRQQQGRVGDRRWKQLREREVTGGASLARPAP